MRGVLVLVFLAAVCFFFEGKARALSDAEHARFLRESSAYAKAEKRLDEVWKKLRKSLPKAEFQRLLEEQRVWLSSLRDEEAKAETEAASPAEAYSLVTERRAAALERKLAGKGAAQADVGPQEPSHVLTPIGHQAQAPASRAGIGRSLAGFYEKELGRVDIEAVGDAFRVSVQTSAPDARWLCETAGMATLEGNALILNNSGANSDAQPVRMTIEGDKLIIGYEHPADICGGQGTIGGVYVKKKERAVQ